MSIENEDIDTIEVPEQTEQIQFAEEAAPEPVAEPATTETTTEETPEERKARKRSEYQKRINDLTREKHEEREARAAAEARAELLEQRLQEAVKTGRETVTTTLKQREQELIEKRRQAEETGDLSSLSNAMEELFEIRSRMRDTGEERQPAPLEEPVRRERAGIVPEAEAWIGRNKWFEARENGHLVSEVVRIQNDIVRRGYDLRDPKDAAKVYEEIDKEIRKRPEFDTVLGVEETGEETDKPTPRSHIAPPSRGGEPPARQKPGELSKHDIAAIKRAGLDPNNPKVRSTYLKYNRKQA